MDVVRRGADLAGDLDAPATLGRPQDDVDHSRLVRDAINPATQTIAGIRCRSTAYEEFARTDQTLMRTTVVVQQHVTQRRPRSRQERSKADDLVSRHG
ncbi:hypothetical protein Lesp02_35600 [Lentzea sp. NBRC 105346]|nr:hypothetical protein Lesp02_35600 [Lentzea sp. NBRC 105346]